MEAIVPLLLPAMVLIAVAVMGFAFLKEAFAVPRGVGSATPLQLPLLRGEDLRHWAAARSKSVLSKYVERPWTRATAAAAAREVERQASQIIERVSNSPSKAGAQTSLCYDRGEVPILLTIPESLAVAQELRSNVPRALARRVIKRVSANMQATTAAAVAAKDEGHVCPLLGDDGHCLVFSSRPLQCRARSGDSDRQNAETAQFAVTVSEGMREGLCQALQAIGMDGHCYELNRSLLDTMGDREP